MNIERSAYDNIVSSGDVTRKFVAQYANKPVHHVGPAYDEVVFDGLNVIFADEKKAQAIIVTGLDNDYDDLKLYDERLKFWLKRKLPLICTNPDKIVEIGDKIIYCAGALADKYAQMGGEVLMAGKPNRAIYREAFSELAKIMGRSPDKEKILAIGDSVRTDARGAANMGIDFLFIAGSIHAKELDAFGNIDEQKICSLIGPSKANLIGFQPMLK